jgi:hypothetical protein
MSWVTGVRFPATAGIFLFAITSRPALGFNQSPIQRVPRALSPDRGVKLTTRLHLVPMLRMGGALSPLSHVFMACCLVRHRKNLFNDELSLRTRFRIFARYEGISKSFRTGHLERELQMVRLSAT